MTSDTSRNVRNRLFSKRWRLTLTCISIGLNAATAGGIFTFPLISESADIGKFRLTQPQISSIVLAGMTLGQYPVAPLVGSAIDKVGPWACSLAASILFSTGFGLFSLEFRNAPAEHSEHGPSRWAFYRLLFSFFLTGLGTVTSYFSALFSASKNFPKHTGLAAGGSMALFGLSPLILSLFASKWFTDSTGGLKVAEFTAFLAILTGIIHLLGAINLHVEPQLPEVDVSTATEGGDDDIEAPTERTPLVGNIKKLETYDSTWDVLNDYHFWILAVASLLTLGACEMVVANIGTISLALPPTEVTTGVPLSIFKNSSSVSTATTQVRLLSISNTASRLTTGPMADFISPVASYLPSGLLVLPRKHKISRVAFLLGSCILMTLSFLWMVLGVTTQQGIWAFSVGIGVAYGSTFTVLPSLIASIWGTPNLARNFGLITYSPFIGTSTFSYLYAFIASAATETKDPDGYSEGACVGKQCWRLTFLISAGGGLVAAFCAGVLWKRWHGRV